MKNFRWELILALLAGIGLGIASAWLIAPMSSPITTPASLRFDFKDQFRSLIAASYAASGNLERARARLTLLGDPDPLDALSAQAQQMLAAGNSGENVQQLARLAKDLKSPQTANLLPTPSRTPTQPPVTLIALDSPLPGLSETVIPDQVIEPPATVSTATPRPTRTPTPAAGEPYQLVAQDSLCDPNLAEALLQIIVLDGRRRQVPGVEIVVTWDGGEERFFTGFKPELGDGYADVIMQSGVNYSVRVADTGTPVSNVAAPPCATSDGVTFFGALRLTFQRP